MNNNVTNHKIFYKSCLPSRIFKLPHIMYYFPAGTYVYSMGKDTSFNSANNCKNSYSYCATHQYSHYYFFLI